MIDFINQTFNYVWDAVTFGMKTVVVIGLFALFPVAVGFIIYMCYSYGCAFILTVYGKLKYKKIDYWEARKLIRESGWELVNYHKLNTFEVRQLNPRKKHYRVHAISGSRLMAECKIDRVYGFGTIYCYYNKS